ncbi:MAG: hypothetical protein QOE90_1188 [Thermoplasmata archaeon]|nr:hypothetical protein [Thermoplasmata archaeon]
MGEEIVYDLDALDGRRFEHVMGRIFQRLGYHVTQGKGSHDEGRDLVLRRGPSIVVVECKHMEASVGRPTVQKLHSAALTYPGATEALLVTTSRFSEAAEAYAAEVNARTGPRLQLVDFARLVQMAREAGVFLTLGRQGTGLTFHVPCRDDETARATLGTRHLAPLKGHPRTALAAAELHENALEVIPVVAVDYEVERSFETTVGHLYTASERGRVLVPVQGHLADAEREHWQTSATHRVEHALVEGRAPAAYFGVPLERYQAQVAAGVASRLTREVSYSGRNNVSYTKLCEVRPADVQTSAKQVLLYRRRLRLQIGPRAYRVDFADDAARPWRVCASEGFAQGVSAFESGRGYLCNDCGLIAPESGEARGVACATCRRTLCSPHAWRWPSRLALAERPALCSTCYARRDPAPDHLAPSSAALDAPAKVQLLSFVPGLPFLLAKRFVPGALLAAGAVGALSLFWLDPAAAPGALAASVVAGAGAGAAWSRRLRAHRSNLERLARYAVAWR